MTITREEVAQAARDWADAFNSRDLDRLWGMECDAVGFGYRSRDARPMARLGREGHRAANEGFFHAVDHYRLEFDTLETDVAGDLGFAWGWYTEEFQHKGQPPERARVRFSQVMQKEGAGWKVLLFHRDIQPFGDDGRYPRSLTTG
ncbi:MAG: hypothetical protein Kow0010_07710 [Dehalococcoidia bacterium]